MKRLIMVVNEDRFFLSHRKDIALKAQTEGFDVTIVCKDTGRADEVKAFGSAPVADISAKTSVPSGMSNILCSRKWAIPAGVLKH